MRQWKHAKRMFQSSMLRNPSGLRQSLLKTLFVMRDTSSRENQNPVYLPLQSSEFSDESTGKERVSRCASSVTTLHNHAPEFAQWLSANFPDAEKRLPPQKNSRIMAKPTTESHVLDMQKTSVYRDAQRCKSGRNEHGYVECTSADNTHSPSIPPTSSRNVGITSQMLSSWICWKRV